MEDPKLISLQDLHAPFFAVLCSFLDAIDDERGNVQRRAAEEWLFRRWHLEAMPEPEEKIPKEPAAMDFSISYVVLRRALNHAKGDIEGLRNEGFAVPVVVEAHR